MLELGCGGVGEKQRRRCDSGSLAGGGVGPALQARGVPRTDWSGTWSPPRGKVEEFTFLAQLVGRLASTLTLLIRNHALALPDDKQLLDEVRNSAVAEDVLRASWLDHYFGDSITTAGAGRSPRRRAVVRGCVAASEAAEPSLSSRNRGQRFWKAVIEKLNRPGPLGRCSWKGKGWVGVEVQSGSAALWPGLAAFDLGVARSALHGRGRSPILDGMTPGQFPPRHGKTVALLVLGLIHPASGRRRASGDLNESAMVRSRRHQRGEMLERGEVGE